MKQPTIQGSPDLYEVSTTHQATVGLSRNKRFRVDIFPRMELEPGEIFNVTAESDTALEFDTMEEVVQHLLEHAEEDYRDQFLR